MFAILLKMGLPIIIRALEGKIGQEAMDVLSAAVMVAATAALSGDEKRAEAWTFFFSQVAELKLAIASEIEAGVPWYLNLAFEALVARAKLAGPEK
jgi:hypothetical protein